MQVRDAVLAELLNNREHFLSGEQLASSLAVSRSAVWKAIGRLRAEGYRIEAVTHRGYRLAGGDRLSREGILAFLRSDFYDIQYCERVASTNTLVKLRAEEGCAEGTVVVAGEQSGGRGRRGRTFFSPPGTGVYLSVLLRPSGTAEAALPITTAAAVAAAQAIEELSGREAQIKWVNDVYVDGKKVCGILTEASLDVEGGGLHYAVLGVGINVLEPEGGFPGELAERAGAVFERATVPDLRCRVAAAFLDRFAALYRSLGSDACYEEYRRRCLVIGKQVTVFSGGLAVADAAVLDLERDYSLRVRYDDGIEALLNSGEVSVLP